MTQFAKAVPPANPNKLSVMTDSQVDLSCKSILIYDDYLECI